MAQFSTAFLSASDLAKNEDTVVTIKFYETETLRQGERTVRKWVLHFKELDGGLPLNAVNGRTICDMYGWAMDNWIDNKIALYVDPSVEYNGQEVGGIRVRRRIPSDSAS